MFASSMYSGPLWDDYVFIFENEQITKNNNPFIFFNPFIKDHRAWPLGYTFFWFIYKVFGENWILYKILNIFIHYINSILIFKYLKKQNFKYALAPTLLFAIHPLHIETVSWIFQFNTMISITFLLLCIDYWSQNSKEIKKKPYLISLLFFCLSLMTKSYALFVPFYLWSTLKLNIKSRLLFITPFIIASALAGFSTIRGVTSSGLENQKQINYQLQASTQKNNPNSKSLTSLQVIDVPNSESKQIEKENKPFVLQESFDEMVESKSVLKAEIDTNKIINVVKDNWFEIIIDRYIVISNNFGFYFSSFLTLTDRNLFQPPFSQLNTFSIIFNLLIFTLLIVAIFLITMKHSQRLQLTKQYMILLISLFIPVSGIVYIPFMKYSPVADHWFYFAVMPLSYLLIELIVYISDKFALRKHFRSLYILFAIPLVFFSIESFRYGSLFNDHESLFLSNIDAYPHNVFLYRYLAQFYEKQGDIKNSKIMIEQGLMLHPTDIGLIIDWQRITK